MYAAPIPLAIASTASTRRPRGSTGWRCSLWFTVFTLLFRQAVSLYHVPHLALGAELIERLPRALGRDELQQDLRRWWAAPARASSAGPGSQAAEGGTSRARRLRAARRGGRAGRGARDLRVGVLHARPDPAAAPARRRRPHQPARARSSPRCCDCLRNRNYRLLLLGLLLLSATIGVRETLNSYVSLFFWELPEQQDPRLRAWPRRRRIILAFVLTVRLHAPVREAHHGDRRRALLVMVAAIDAAHAATARAVPRERRAPLLARR